MTDAFSVRSGHARGLTRGAMRSQMYRSPLYGARVSAALAGTDDQILRAALLEVASGDQFFSHTSAALLHGIPLPLRFRGSTIHLASPTLGSRMRRPGIVGHRLKAEVVLIDGVPVESPLDTIVHLATLLSVPELVVAIDWALQPRNGLDVSKVALVERLDHFKGARGLGRLRAAIATARIGSESPKETELRMLVGHHGFPDPALNVDVRDAAGRFIGRVDMAWPDLRIALEYDGEQHRVDSVQYARDIERVAALEAQGWIVVRATKEHLRRPTATVIPRLREAFARRGRAI